MSESFRFKIPYSTTSHGSELNGINWEDGHIAYHDLYNFASEAVTVFTHLYSYGNTKCKFLSEILSRPILNLQDFNRPQPISFYHKRWCSLISHCHWRHQNHAFPLRLVDIPPADEILLKCPKDLTRHTANFVSGL